jgi:tRNA (cmo5U34)-methyltransferase
MDKSNTWLDGRGAGQVELYVQSADLILPERNTIIDILLDIFRYHFDGREKLSILDLGCGDGIVTERMRSRFPGNTFYLLDGSPAMLEKAKRRLEGVNLHFLCQTFDAYVDSSIQDAKYDLIFSVNAIHHLSFLEKGGLYTKLFRELKHGGLFMNSDPVLPSSERSEAWQFGMWRDWINKRCVESGLQDEIGQYDDLALEYKQKPENKPSELFEQVQLLERIGFRDVDCFFKYGIFTLFGGTK